MLLTVYNWNLLMENHLAIAALHEEGYLHRDISMKNTLIDDSGEETDGLRDGLLIDFDYAIHDLDNRAVGDLHRTVCPFHVPYPHSNRAISDGSIAGNDSIHGGSALNGSE
jgi:serine/threonine protein kinase